MTWLIRMMQGGVTAALSAGMLYCIKRADKGHGLPKRDSLWFLGASFMGGFLLLPADAGTTAFMAAFISCLAAMAYTDACSGQVYPFFYLIVAFAGYMRLLALQDWTGILSAVIFAVAVLSASLLRAYTLGDAELFLAAAPFLALLAEREQAEALLIFFFYWCASAFFGIATWLLKRARRKNWGRKFAMAPAMYLALLSILFFESFI